MKYLLALIVLFLGLSLNAQPNPAKKAKKFTDEITKVLSLSEEESKAIYEIQLNRFNETQAINEEFANDSETKKEKLKELSNKVFNQVKNVIGVERQKQWKDYKSNN